MTFKKYSSNQPTSKIRFVKLEIIDWKIYHGDLGIFPIKGNKTFVPGVIDKSSRLQTEINVTSF